MKLFVFVVVVGLVASAPQSLSASTVIPILEFQNDNTGDGSYNYRFRTGNEIDREEQGSLKEVVVQGDEGRDEVRRVPVVRGVIRYPKEDGTFYELSYVADELGFRPVSAEIPSAPLP